MTRRRPIHLSPRVYRTSELRDHGVSAQRLRAPDIRRIARGYVIHPALQFDPFDYRQRCIAVAETLRDGHFISHRSAATLWGMPAPVTPGGRVDVSSFSPLKAPQTRIVSGHRIRTGSVEWAEIDGIVTPTPADIWCQLAAAVTFEQLVAAGDFLISGTPIVDVSARPHAAQRRTPPLCTLDDIERARRRHQGTTGSPLRRRAVAMLRAPVDSPPESYLRLAILRAPLPEPIVNCPVATRDRVLFADLGYPELRIAIEYEGKYHFANATQVKFDLRRRRAMIDAGWTVLQATDEDLADPTDFIAALARAIAVATAAQRSVADRGNF